MTYRQVVGYLKIPVLVLDGREWFEAKKPFATPEDLQLLLNELTSSPKAFKDWEITSQVTKKNRDYAISGVVDLTDGFDLFTDEALNGLLEEPPLGIPIATLEESLGSPIEDAVTLQVVINLPDQNNEEIINIPLGEERVIEVTGNSEHRVAQILDWVVLAVIALLGLSVILALLNWYLDKRYEEKQLQRRPVTYCTADTREGEFITSTVPKQCRKASVTCY